MQPGEGWKSPCQAICPLDPAPTDNNIRYHLPHKYKYLRYKYKYLGHK